MSMLFEILLGVILVILAYQAIHAKKLIYGVIYLSAMSMISVVAYTWMQAPDVAITEAVIGSGLVTALFLFTLLSTKGGTAK